MRQRQVAGRQGDPPEHHTRPEILGPKGDRGIAGRQAMALEHAVEMDRPARLKQGPRLEGQHM